jgi:hypothetical protein
VDELRNLQCQKSDEIKHYVNDFFITDVNNRKGIVDFQVPIGESTSYSRNFIIENDTTPWTIRVGYVTVPGAQYGGLGYTGDGSRVLIDQNTIWQCTTCYTPVSPINCKDPYGQPLRQVSGNYNVPLAACLNTNVNTVWIDYLQVVCPTGQIVDTEDVKSYLVEYKDGYEVLVQNDSAVYPAITPPVGHPNALYLGKVVVSGSSYVSDNDESLRTYLKQRGETVSVRWPTPTPAEITVQTHVCHKGSGTISCINPHGLALEDLGIGPDENAQLHQRYFHEKAMLRANPLCTNSALYPAIDAPNCRITIQGMYGVPIDERLVIDQNMYTSSDAVCQVPVAGSSSDKVFSELYDSGTFLTKGCCAYYFYIDSSLPASPLLTWSPAVLPTDQTSIYPIFSVCWNCTTCLFSCAQDLRVFKNVEGQYQWNTCAARRDCLGRLGYNNQTNLFEGYDGTNWLPFHAGGVCVYEDGGTAQCYCLAHGLCTTPLGLVTLRSCGCAWISSCNATCLTVCTDANATLFTVFAWKKNV